jgi:hypothetical protein
MFRKLAVKYKTRRVSSPRMQTRMAPKLRMTSPNKTKRVSAPVIPSGKGKRRNERQDMSLEPLLEKLSEGYATVTWQLPANACQLCRSKGLAGKKWLLKDFVKNLQYNAPIFERAHPNSYSSLLISGIGKPNVIINSEGIVG